MFNNFIQYRIEEGVDTVLQTYNYDDKKLVMKYYPHGSCGVDKIGRPVIVEWVGIVKFKELLEICKFERVSRMYI